MLVKFVLELDAIIYGNVKPADIRLFFDTWKEYGILVHPSRKEILSRNESEDLGKVWTVTWKKYQAELQYRSLNEGSFDWEKIQSDDDLAQHSGKFEVALLEESHAKELGIGDGETKNFGEIEGFIFEDHDLWRAEFQKTSLPRIASLTYIASGSDREDIWEKYFRRLAEFSQEIVIVDRYAVQEPDIQGIFWLLERLTDISKSSTIQINSSVNVQRGQDRRPYEIEEQFKKKFQNKSVITTKVRLFDDRDPMSKIAHDRHIRFDNYVIGIGRGPAAIFSNERISAGTDVHTRILNRSEQEEKEKALDDVDPRRIVHRFPLPQED